MYSYLIPVLPLIGFLINGFCGKKLGKRVVGLIGCGVVLLAFLLAVHTFFHVLSLPVGQRTDEQIIYRWISAGDFEVAVGFLIDPLSLVMLLIVTGVGFLIHVYSTGYMAQDERYHRYFAYLNLFTFFMLILVMANNFLLMFVGWEGVGLCSYLLIGFWFEKASANVAGFKAFIVNKVGDFAFIISLFLIFTTFGTLNFLNVFGAADEILVYGSSVAVAITLLLFVGAMGKSAQVPLHVWLPDAMEGPTPVSALIHAATMVTAGVYMVARCSALFELAPFTMNVVAGVGTVTAFYAASVGLVQRDIKKVLAYSTISQLGYMFLAVGVGAYAAGIFHLTTHAFFKSLLFLGAGSVIHAQSGEQDLFKMGGLKRELPKTYWTFMAASLAIAGIFPFAGFFSKDAILWQAFSEGSLFLWIIGSIAAFMTAFYIFRLVFLTFHGESRINEHVRTHIHESPNSMVTPLMFLAVLSLLGGLIGLPIIKGGNVIGEFLSPVFATAGAEEAHHSMVLEIGMMTAATIIALAGIGLAYLFYVRNPERPVRLAERAKAIYRLLSNKYYFDELYHGLVVRPITAISSFLWWFFDEKLVDGFLVHGLAGVVQDSSNVLRKLQTGVVQNYALWIAAGAIFIVAYLMFG